ncbi:MAG TPA: hypothetical protein VEW91_02790 [bacterium]|nr:hypothetical protein [bacterium]
MGTQTDRKALRATAAAVAIAAAMGLGGGAAATAAGFPDVPPWHWAYAAVTRDQDAGVIIGYPTSSAALIENTIVQVFDGFAHASTSGAQAWVERFSYNLPPSWPAPLRRSQIVTFSLTGMRISVNGDTAAAAFTAALGIRGGQSVTVSMRVVLRSNGQDWQVNYVTLARASPLFM